MPFFHDFDSENNLPISKLKAPELFSIFYHNIFEYPLTFSELLKWVPKNPPKVNVNISYKNGLYFVKGNDGLIYKRSVRKRFSSHKIQIAKKAANILTLIPSIRMVGITGSLAMDNAKKSSDIDILIITQKGRLWTTRIIAYFLLKICGLHIRKQGNIKQEDMLCLNIWLDESSLVWPKKERNFYTAHEILQINPLINKKHSYESLLSKNKWVFDYWYNFSKTKLVKHDSSYMKFNNVGLIELIAYKIQLFYMKGKITKEVAKLNRAIFHPVNLGNKIIKTWT